jgi:UDP-4-amino-4,6-dideoxy-N-acetyl-beta-L-altrosamine N-acetyltransferase
MKEHVELVPIISLDTETQFQILAIRNEPRIREVMFTDHVIGANEHLQWLNGIKQDHTRLVFAILDSARKPLGVVTIGSIDRLHRKALWGFYLKDDHPKGLGSAVLLVVLDFAFGDLGLEKLDAEVVATNKAALKVHARLGFREEGLRRGEIVKGGIRTDVRLFGLVKEEWMQEKSSIYEAHQAVFERFDIEIKWIAREADENEPSPIDRIEAARAKNNLNWMSILRIAIEKAPVTSQQIVTDIRKLDGEISALTDKLIKPE